MQIEIKEYLIQPAVVIFSGFELSKSNTNQWQYQKQNFNSTAKVAFYNN